MTHSVPTRRSSDLGGREVVDEFEEQLLDDLGIDRAEVGHVLGDFLDLLVIEQRPDLGRMLLAERKHQDRRLVGALELPEVLRSEEHTSELQSLMRISYDVFCLQKKTNK